MAVDAVDVVHNLMVVGGGGCGGDGDCGRGGCGGGSDGSRWRW